MRNLLHCTLSSGDSNAIDVGAWSISKIMNHPKRISTSANLLVLIGKVFLSRVILEVERIFFGSKEDVTFSKKRKEADMILTKYRRLV